MTTASVELWGRRIGAVTWLPDKGISVFQYTPEFASSRLQVSPMMMPLREAPYEFPELSKKTFKGLPGMLTDSLPDKFGNALIDVWLARQSRSKESFNPVERLCYMGSRGMGALEFQPVIRDTQIPARIVEVESLVKLSNHILDKRTNLHGRLNEVDEANVVEDILRVGTSAGGARAKAVLAWNESTGEFRSGQVEVDKGYSHWLMKFDGVTENRDKELADPLGYGRIEYAYYLMAQQAGITMMPCRLHEEGGRAHFMTRRFDRTGAGKKRHYQSLGAIMHYDFEMPGAYSYEQVIILIKRLGLSAQDIDQQVRRTFFNIIARNQDDHVKNIGFVMNQQGEWRLSPAFDVVYSYNPVGDWTSQHQMSLNGKRDHFEFEDLMSFAKMVGMKRAKAIHRFDEVNAAVKNWQEHAANAAVFPHHIKQIENMIRSIKY